jgi:hypothetical protein
MTNNPISRVVALEFKSTFKHMIIKLQNYLFKDVGTVLSLERVMLSAPSPVPTSIVTERTQVTPPEPQMTLWTLTSKLSSGDAFDWTRAYEQSPWKS